MSQPRLAIVTVVSPLTVRVHKDVDDSVVTTVGSHVPILAEGDEVVVDIIGGRLVVTQKNEDA